MATASIPAPYPNPSTTYVWTLSPSTAGISTDIGEAICRDIWYTAWEKSFWNSGFMGESSNSVIQVKHDLEAKQSGAFVHYYLIGEDTGAPIDNSYEAWGSEEKSTIYTDNVKLGLVRHAKRIRKPGDLQYSVFDYVKLMNELHQQWWIDQGFDKMITRKLSGLSYFDAGGTATSDAIGEVAVANTNILYAGDATSTATIDETDKFTLDLLYKAREAAEIGTLGTTTMRKIAPVNNYYHVVLHPYQAYDLVNDSNWRETFLYGDVRGGANELLRPHKNLPTMPYTPFAQIEDMMIWKYRGITTASTWGASANLNGATALFLGRQAGLFAMGHTNMEFVMDEGPYKEYVGTMTRSLCGFDKAYFNSIDNGVIAIKTYANKHYTV